MNCGSTSAKPEMIVERLNKWSYLVLILNPVSLDLSVSKDELIKEKYFVLKRGKDTYCCIEFFLRIRLNTKRDETAC